MKTIREFPYWFSKQKLSGKIVIGLVFFVMFYCFCCFPVLAVISKPPTPDISQITPIEVSSIQTAAVETVMAEAHQTETDIAPTDTPTLAIPTETPIPTKTAEPTKILSPEELLLRLSEESFKDDLIEAKLSGVSGTKYATVDYDLGFQWDEETAIRSANIAFVRFAPKVFDIQGVDVLELRFFTVFTDVYGNDKKEVALKYTITKELSEKINWDRIAWRQIGVILNLEGDGNGVYVHPALKSSWLKYISEQ